MTPVKPFRFMPLIRTERRLLASISVMLMCSVVWPVCSSFMAFIFIACLTLLQIRMQQQCYPLFALYYG